MCENTDDLFIQALKENVRPATGCTEPVAVAYAAATARSLLDDPAVGAIEAVKVQVSPNIMKNALAVIVPGTGQPGLKVATAAGIVSGDCKAGLKVIADIREDELSAILDLARSGKITVGVAPVDDDLYVGLRIVQVKDDVTVTIAGDHTNIFRIEKNGVRLKDEPRPAAHELSPVKQALQKHTLQEIWDFSLNAPFERIAFMEEAGTMNMDLAREGLSHEYGLGLGRSMDGARKVGFGSGTEADLSTKMIAYASAASDARMGGAQLPAMSNSGSGNQGITASVPVSAVAEQGKADRETRVRALTLSHLTVIYIHAFLPILSAFCAADTAAMGAAVAIVYLMGHDYDVAARAVQNMAGDADGMICDGAGCSCAMKVASSVSSMHRCVNLAMQGTVIPSSNGMVCPDVDETIRGIGKLGTTGMRATDKTILEIMLAK